MIGKFGTIKKVSFLTVMNKKTIILKHSAVYLTMLCFFVVFLMLSFLFFFHKIFVFDLKFIKFMLSH